jgi:hypothetical protein
MENTSANREGAGAVKTSLVLAFVALNLTVGGLVSWLKLPVYLDSLGIVMATILMGWRYGVWWRRADLLAGIFQ